ncbi:MAG: type I restriction-modification system subunit M N-terminal domain-containing protein [archaeon]|nr:type I restriction-modification system subunit M N-terminal domain-containing protein [archaeon]MCQ2971539.1 type I restriction-modification system subunit M N-terminal domain-containing protein [archaeon]
MNDDKVVHFKSVIYQEMAESRGSWSTSEYRNLVLNIILLVYLSNKFKVKYLELVNESEGYEEDIDEYSIENIFYLPQESRWDYIMENIEAKNVKEIFYRALDYLKHSNPPLKEVVFPFSIFEIDEYALRTFLYIFKDYISDNNLENEVWIKIYKSFLKDFAGLHQEYNFVLEKIDKII